MRQLLYCGAWRDCCAVVHEGIVVLWYMRGLLCCVGSWPWHQYTTMCGGYVVVGLYIHEGNCTCSWVLIVSVKRQCDRLENLFISVSAICLFSWAACRTLMMSSSLLMGFCSSPKHLVFLSLPAQIVSRALLSSSANKSQNLRCRSRGSCMTPSPRRTSFGRCVRRSIWRLGE